MPQYLINPLIQTELIHLCAGPSGAGKTRWLLTMLHNQWRRGKEVLGHRSYPVPWIYVPLDRPYSSVETTLLDLDIDPLHINVMPAVDLEYRSINEIIDHADNLGCKLLVIEMFSYLLHGQQNTETVRDFMWSVQKALRLAGMTIIGTMECPKMRPKDLYGNPRQRISGPASWGHCAETIFLVEPYKESPTRRTIRVLPRNGPEELYYARFYKNGKMYLDTKSKMADLSEIDSADEDLRN